MRKETRDRMQPIQRHAALLGILLERFAFQITELALDLLQRRASVALLATLMCAAIAFTAWRWGLPMAATMAADWLPAPFPGRLFQARMFRRSRSSAPSCTPHCCARSSSPDTSGPVVPSTQKLVAGHAGTIEFDSRVGQGTTFRVLLPSACDHERLLAKSLAVQEGAT